MHRENSITINAPIRSIFEAAADLSQWPTILPHYRWIRYIKKDTDRNVVVMAAMRGWIPIQWTSEQEIDYQRREVRFHHVKAFTKGMDVVWTFTQSSDGVEVKISHDLKPRIPLIGRFIADEVIGGFFIHFVASETLRQMKTYLEKVSTDASEGWNITSNVTVENGGKHGA
jgi:ribosome-associated toxin RatA of RatAB toxin-antitoxin module